MKPNLGQLKRFVGNPDAYSIQQEDGSWRPVREPLYDSVLRQHLAGDITVGTYVGHKVEYGPPINTTVTEARTLVFDLDTGDVALQDAERVKQALIDLGVGMQYIGLEFSGKKGYHVWVLLQEPRLNAELRRVGRAVLALTSLQCEVFPKQDDVRDLGNLVELPGGIHRVTLANNDFIGAVPIPMPVAVWKRVREGLGPEIQARRERADNRFPCLERIQEGVSEGGRNNQLFQLATMFRRHGATDDTLRAILEHVNAKCTPPMDDLELDNIMESSRTSGPICDQLPAEVREACGGHCIRERLQGLTPRPGQVRHANVGEHVVVMVGAHKGNTITFEHDDIEVAKGSLRES